MESLALLVLYILIGFAVVIIAAVTFTILARIKKVPRVFGWISVSLLGLLTIWTWIAMTDRMGIFLGVPFLVCLALMLVPRNSK